MRFTKELTHSFNDHIPVLQQVGLEVEEGAVYGFLGANGAGKTTTLKLILGLLKMQRGSITVFGQPLQDRRIDILKRIGSLIESPSLYAHLTATQNLQVLQHIYQCPRIRVKEALKQVGLASAGTKTVGRFSLGMKQRLAIAATMLHQPSLLILDEPTNGLDPAGIIEIRELLTQLNRQLGTTIIVSSHLLVEIEKIATHVGLIDQGKLLFQGTLNALQKAQYQQSIIAFETGDDVTALRVIRDEGITAWMENGRVLVAYPEKERVAGIAKNLIGKGVPLYAIGNVKSDLESIYINLTKKNQADE